MGEPDKRAPGVENLLDPNTSRSKLIDAFANDGQDALRDGPLRISPLHLVLQGHSRSELHRHQKQ